MINSFSRIQLTYQDLVLRTNSLSLIVEPILSDNEPWIGGKIDPISTNDFVRLTVSNSTNWRLKTIFDDFSVSYYEEWINSRASISNEEIWFLEKAYFTLFRRNIIKEDYDEIVCLHCWEGFKPDESQKDSNPKGFKQQEIQQKYQRSIHMHLKFLNQYPEEKEYKFIAKSHLAVTLGRNTYEFDSITNLSNAMTQAIQLLKEEILEQLINN